MVKGVTRAGTALLMAAGMCTAVAGTAAAEHAPERAVERSPYEVPLRQAIAGLPVADERREGYDRDLYRHWIDTDRDGCHTRNEVLLAEAVIAPLQDERCRLTGGVWYSYYDNTAVVGPSGLDIDHMVPLAESWDSGAHAWDAQRRQDYANDLGDDRSLVAVTARSNRSKADQDPAEWLPPHSPALCRYLGEWTAVKLRWNLTADQREKDTLTDLASYCPDNTITINPAP